MLDYRIEPIDVWPGAATRDRSRSKFKTIWTKVQYHLEKELAYLGGTRIILRLQVTAWDINKTGMLRADARLREPGVILQFEAAGLKGKPTLLYRCDRFAAWQDNVSAIARGLEALRLIDRYGVTSAGEQYAGFKSLPSTATVTMSAVDAATSLQEVTRLPATIILSDVSVAKEAVRLAIGRTHPDRNMGDRKAYDAVEQARSILSSHHGVSL